MKQWKPSTPLRVVKNTIQTIQLKPRDAHFGGFFGCADIFKLIFLLYIYYLNIFPRNCREPQVSPIVELTLCYDSAHWQMQSYNAFQNVHIHRPI